MKTINAMPTAQGPFSTLYQTAGAVAGAGFADTAKFLSIFPAAADTALGVGQTVVGRFTNGLNAFATGK
ncbi:hypothetical protein Bhyg_12700 [Pseudolycoriella hygida]|uniref:Uncharacterized protein n=1 Tax=Pseudolycoriella hygida TaxID=35572 RepID=A0A9Q0MXQ7_9DIPT|nr:hypothetical protein Bhyg_12700 [Pseudolycoriella hygida]